MYQLGYVVAGAGDLNGDGFDDIVIGEPGFGSGSGRARVYFGGGIVNNVPDLFLGPPSIAEFGRSVAAGADVNGDGYPDILVGAKDAAYLFFGGPTMDAVPDLELAPLQPATDYGKAVALVDMNADGFAECVVGAPSYGFYHAGHAYVYEGSAIPDNSVDRILSEHAFRMSFATALCDAGDVNGDGYHDLLIGQPAPDEGLGRQAGNAYLYFGSAVPDTVPDRVFAGDHDGDFFGRAVAAAGDLNADGYDDVMIGAPWYDPPGLPENTGMVAIYRGGPNMDTTADIGLTGRGPSSEAFGSALVSAGDVNGDGHPDILVGAPGHPDVPYAGRVALFFGGPIIHVSADRVLVHPDGRFGSAVGAAGDVNGDGSPDVLVGAPDVTTDSLQGIHQGAFVLADGRVTVNVPDVPRSFAFLAPAPNPARDRVALTLMLDHADRLDVEAFDVTGRIVGRPVEHERVGPGPVTREWKLGGLPSGIYWLRARFANRETTQRLVHVQGP